MIGSPKKKNNFRGWAVTRCKDGCKWPVVSLGQWVGLTTAQHCSVVRVRDRPNIGLGGSKRGQEK